MENAWKILSALLIWHHDKEILLHHAGPVTLTGKGKLAMFTMAHNNQGTVAAPRSDWTEQALYFKMFEMSLNVSFPALKGTSSSVFSLKFILLSKLSLNISSKI